MVYIPTFTINLCQMWVNIPYMDPMGICFVRIPSIHSLKRGIYAISSPPEGFVLKAENGDRVQHVLKVAKFFAILEKLVTRPEAEKSPFWRSLKLFQPKQEKVCFFLGGLH